MGGVEIAQVSEILLTDSSLVYLTLRRIGQRVESLFKLMTHRIVSSVKT